MPSLDQLYKEVDNLSGLIHPFFGRSFQYMTDDAAIELAQSMTDKIIKSGLKLILIAETGASPFADICERIATQHRSCLRWNRVKFPRQPLSNIFSVLSYFLCEEERRAQLSAQQVRRLQSNPFSQKLSLAPSSSRAEALSQICAQMPADFQLTGPADIRELLDSIESCQQTKFQEAISIVFDGTEVAGQLASPFIYLDEYIDSGTTFRNALAFFRCMVAKPLIKTASYYVNLPDASQHPNVLYTYCTVADKPQCYERGAYPYENRVDLIGHFYRITDDAYVRTDNRSICQEFSDAAPAECQELLSCLFDYVSQNRLLEQVSHAFTEPQVRNYITADQVVRYCLFQLERTVGMPDYAEFLFQLFDMYGPAWSPMPVSFHFDFWNGFEQLETVWRQIPEFELLTGKYRKGRAALLNGAARICLSRRQAWLAGIDRRLEEIYAGKESVSNSGESDRHRVYIRQSD